MSHSDQAIQDANERGEYLNTQADRDSGTTIELAANGTTVVVTRRLTNGGRIVVETPATPVEMRFAAEQMRSLADRLDELFFSMHGSPTA